MALSAVGKVLVSTSLIVAVVALLWPQIEEYFWSTDKQTSEGGCPMGYSSWSDDMKLPDHHPPVFMSKSGNVAKVFVNANIWTGHRKEDGNILWASALSVDADGTVVAVDNTTAADAPDGIEVIDLQGRFVLPGLIDAHAHVINGGLSLSRCTLQAVTSKVEFLDKVREAAEKLPAGAWLLGGGWNEVSMGGDMPDATWLDEAAGGRPALLHRMDGHLGVASSTALTLAGINSSTADPAHGVIDRYPDGRPTGILREHALDLIQDLIPAASKEEREVALHAAARNLLSVGVTTVCDMGRYDGEDSLVWDDLMEIYFPAAAAKKLPLRIAAFVPLATASKLAEFVEAQGGQKLHNGKHLAWGSLKGFADGSLGSMTALMWEAYEGQPDNFGTRVTDVAVMQQHAAEGCAAGLQVAIHAIGDRAVDDVLSLQAAAGCTLTSGTQAAQPGKPSVKVAPRVEHAQHIHNASVAARFAAEGVFAVTNPQHLLSDVHMLEARLGPDRAGPGKAFAYATMLDAKVPLAFGSDWPVVKAGPLEAVFAAVTRRAPGSDPSSAWSPAEGIPLEAALDAHTTSAAQACALGSLVGSLRPSLQADFVVLGSSPFDALSQNRLPDVLRTYVGGNCKYGCDDVSTQ